MKGKSGFVLKAGLFSGLAAVTVAAFLVEAQLTISEPDKSSLSSSSLAVMVLSFIQIWLFASPLAGLFGFVAGNVGALVLSLPVGRVKSLSALVGESVMLGTVLSLSFPVLHKTLRWSGGPEEMLLFRHHLLLLSVATGAITSMLFALFFKSTLLSAD